MQPPVPVLPPPPPDKRVRILTPLIDELLDLKNWDRSTRPPKSWYASSGDDCGRQRFYGMMGFPVEKVIKAQYSRDGDSGTHLHEVYETYLRELGLLHEAEVVVTNPYRIGGRMDGIAAPTLDDITGFYEHEDSSTTIVVPEDARIARFVKKGEKGLLEIKTVKVPHFEAMPQHYKWPKYYAQAQIYLKLRPDLVRCLLLAVCRDDSRTKEWLIERNDPYGSYLIAKIQYLEWCRSQASANPSEYATWLPAAEPSGLCNYCPFQMRCEQDDLKEVA